MTVSMTTPEDRQTMAGEAVVGYNSLDDTITTLTPVTAEAASLAVDLLRSVGVLFPAGNCPEAEHAIEQTGAGAEHELLHLALRSAEIPLQHKIYEIGEAGYLITLGNEMAPNVPMLLADLDDLFVATTAAKKILNENYERYLAEKQVLLSDEQRRRALRMADQFARWPEHGVKKYHIEGNMLALGWVTEMLGDLGGLSADDVLKYCESQLDKVHTQNSNSETAGAHPGFYLRDGKLMAEHVEQSYHEMSGLFMPLLRPKVYEDTAEAIAGAQRDTGANVALFTYGDPFPQLVKTVQLLSASRQIQLSIKQIWLTCIPKGEFLDKLAQYTQDEGSLGDAVRAVFDSTRILHVDDDPDQCDSVERSAANRIMESKVAIRALRIIRPGIKTEQREGLPETEVVDLRQEPEVPVGTLQKIITHMLLSGRLAESA